MYTHNNIPTMSATYRPRVRAAAKPRARKAAPRARAPARRARAPAQDSIAQSVGSSAGQALGSFIGGPAGGALGKVLGKGAGSLFKRITGYGDYKVKYNTIANGDQVPMLSNSGNARSVMISHREYIADVISSSTAGAFNISTYAIQPALLSSFPWLGNVAESFEQYRIHGMVYEFKTMSADALNSTNTALGQVIMATQYDVNADAFVNKQQMENYEFGMSCKPSVSMMHPIECAPGDTPVQVLYTRSGDASGDYRLYDWGNFSIATNGCQGTSVNLGELWVTYQIEFLKPRLSGSVDLHDHWQLAGDVTSAAPFGTGQTYMDGSDLGAVLDNKAGTITFPRGYTGNVMIVHTTVGAGTALNNATWTPSGGASDLKVLRGDTYSYFGTGGATATQSVQGQYFSLVNGGVITISGGTYNSTCTSADLVIVSIPANFLT